MDEIPYGYCHCGCGLKTDLSKENRPNRGYFKGKPLLFLKHHSAKKRGVKPGDVGVRFWSKVDIRSDDECWDWKGQVHEYNGCTAYGKFYLNGKKVFAHRVAYELAFGKIPEGMCVLHKCDRGICCNPNHYFLGTRVDNAKDRDSKGRCRAAGKPGEGCGHAKLKNEDVFEIRKLFSEGISYEEIANRFGVTKSNVNYIVRGKTWRNIL